MSTFGLLNTAYSGLAAARAALDTTGQNIANVNTEGYTRQRVSQASISGVGNSSLFVNGLNLGEGVRIAGIDRLADSLVDANVRNTASSSGYWTAAAGALGTVETSLGEPGATGLSTTLSRFWQAWGNLSNHAGDEPVSADLLSAANTLVDRIRSGATAAATAWSDQRSATSSTVTTVNQLGSQVAALNQQILRITASGGSANELVDQRSTALTKLAGLASTTTRPNANGTVDVLLGGSTFVSGDSVRSLALTGSISLASAGASPVGLAFADAATVPLQVDGGTLAAQLTTLKPANASGSGGVYAEASAVYDRLAQSVAAGVNQVHESAYTPDGTTGHAFFGPTSAGTAITALTLTVVPTDAAGIATAATATGPKDGSQADRIAQLATAAGSPDATWSSYVSGLGTLSKAASTQSTIADASSAAAGRAQTSQSGVDLDEETANLVVFQHAYQGAARVITAIDEMLDTLINKTGLVGR